MVKSREFRERKLKTNKSSSKKEIKGKRKNHVIEVDINIDENINVINQENTEDLLNERKKKKKTNKKKTIVCDKEIDKKSKKLDNESRKSKKVDQKSKKLHKKFKKSKDKNSKKGIEEIFLDKCSSDSKSSSDLSESEKQLPYKRKKAENEMKTNQLLDSIACEEMSNLNQEKKLDFVIKKIEKQLSILVDCKDDCERSLKEALDLYPENSRINEFVENFNRTFMKHTIIGTTVEVDGRKGVPIEVLPIVILKEGEQFNKSQDNSSTAGLSQISTNGLFQDKIVEENQKGIQDANQNLKHLPCEETISQLMRIVSEMSSDEFFDFPEPEEKTIAQNVVEDPSKTEKVYEKGINEINAELVSSAPNFSLGISDDSYDHAKNQLNDTVAQISNSFEKKASFCPIVLADQFRSPYMNIKTDVLEFPSRTELKISRCLYAMQPNPLLVIFQSDCGQSSMHLQLETFAEGLWLYPNIIDCWSVVLNAEEQYREQNSPRRYFFNTRILSYAMVQGDILYDDMFRMFKSNLVSAMHNDADLLSFEDIDLVFFPIMFSYHYYLCVFNLKTATHVIIDNDFSAVDYEAANILQRLFTEYLYSIHHIMSEAICINEPKRLELNWMTEGNDYDCGIILMRHMESYMGESENEWNSGLIEDFIRQKEQLRKLRAKYATKILLSDVNKLRNEYILMAQEFNKIKLVEQSRIIDCALKNRAERINYL